MKESKNMFAELAILLLGAAYVGEVAKESTEAKKEAEEKILFDYRIKLTRYAILNRITYKDVVLQLKSGKLTDAEIDRYIKETCDD